MKLQELFKITALAAVIGLVGCEASVEPGAGGGVDDSGTGAVIEETDADGDGIVDGTADTPFVPNDGSTEGGEVVENVDDGTGTGGTIPTIIAGEGSDPAKRFICTRSARDPLAQSTASAGGLVGGPLGGLLDTLGGEAVTQLTAGVTDQELAIDGRLSSGSSIKVAADLLGLLSSVGQTITLPKTQNAGGFAVFALEFPANTLQLSLLSSITVQTNLGDTLQEEISIDQTTLDLLGGSYAFLGLKTHLPWDSATVSYSADLLSVSAGEAALKALELCTDGILVDPPVAPAP